MDKENSWIRNIIELRVPGVTEEESQPVEEKDLYADVSNPHQREILETISTIDLQDEEDVQWAKERIYAKLAQDFPQVPDDKLWQKAEEEFISYVTFEKLASRDSLTGLYNRLGYTLRGKAELKKLESEGTKLAVILRFDLSGFKGVNDGFGHHAGDAMLKAVAEVITKHLPPKRGNLAARLGGDEFALALFDTNEEEILTAFQNIATDCALISIEATHLETGEKRQLRIRKPHCGGALWEAGMGLSFEALDQRADHAQVEFANKRKAEASEVGVAKRYEDTFRLQRRTLTFSIPSNESQSTLPPSGAQTSFSSPQVGEQTPRADLTVEASPPPPERTD